MDTQGRAPLWEALLNYREQQINSWHTPGHKEGSYTWPSWRQVLGEGTLALDLTELPGLDNLACPAGVIRSAQEKAAAFFGVARTFFLVNGASSGLMAVLLATCRPGDEVLLPRYAHRSVFSGLILSGARPVYLETPWLDPPGLPLGVPPAVLARTLQEHPRARLLVLNHPTYEGVVPRCRELVALAHEHGLAVVADAAHGAHYGLDPVLPPSPLALGADYVVQSTHKTLGALTQAAMLHLREEGEGERIAAALNLLQTSSPSYLLLASLDVARLLAEEGGRRDWGRAVARALALRRQLAAAGITCLRPQDVTGAAAAGLDVTRLLLPAASTGMSGGEMALALRRAGHEVELAAPGYILLIITPGDSEEKIHSLKEALLALPRVTGSRRVGAKGTGETSPGSAGVQPRAAASCPGKAAGKGETVRGCPPMVLPRQALAPREAWLAPRRELPLQKAEGWIAAELIAPCPPGLALVVPGEVLAGEVLARLVELRGPGGKVLVVDEGR
ncbi:MAG: aminotransferase class I/II-fold pyridoxal phosphate-dependent enzyme [Moorella sp. (in: Bacteria)]|nr:aminotransferase class I/II-fold pyridoxal phosphate-dependent enzyme [Moorella sp. (in: firmicutes)]